MGFWLDQARTAAARRAGRRWWRWLLAAHLLRVAAPGLIALAVALTATALIWQAAAGGMTWLHHHNLAISGTAGLDWPALLRLLALGAGLIWLGWTARDLITGAALRRRQTGARQPIPTLALGAALALTVASMLIR